MLERSIYAECQKLRRSMLWPALIILPLISVAMGSFNYTQNVEILKSEWLSLWTQVTLFYCYFFLPALIGIYCSYICRLEHLHHNWNMVMAAPISIFSIFFSKLITVSCLTFITQMLIGIFFWISGTIMGLTSAFPLETIGWLFKGWCASIVVASFQLCLSLRIRSFAVPIGISMMGGIGGLILLAKGLGCFFPFSLLPLGMAASDPFKSFTFTDTLQFTISSIAFFFLFCLYGLHKLKSDDVIT